MGNDELILNSRKQSETTKIINVFGAYLKKNTSLNQEEIELIYSYFKIEFLKKEQSLLVAGNKFKKLIYVVDGILRIYIIDNNGNEIVKNFLEPNCLFADAESFDKDKNSLLNVCTVTKCTILTLSRFDYEELIKKLPKWEYLMKVVGMQAMQEMIKRKEFLLIGNSAEQYRYFIEHFSNLARQVPLKYIASFLRVTQSSLSRIRKNYY